MYKQERDALEMRKIGECDMEEFGTLLIDSSENMIAVLGGRWWPQAAKLEGDKINKTSRCDVWKQLNETPNCWACLF